MTTAAGIAILATAQNVPLVSSYWLPGAGILIPLIISVGQYVFRPAETKEEADEALASAQRRLRGEAKQQWVSQFGPQLGAGLTVPFSVKSRLPLAALPALAPSSNGASGKDSASDEDSVVFFLAAKGQPRCLVILGRPGSGKSILAMRLAERLLAVQSQDGQDRGGQAAGGHDDAVPVYLSLATCDLSKVRSNRGTGALTSWAAQQLARTYPWLASGAPGGGSLAVELIKRHKVLLVLDGFDEIPEGSRKGVFQTLALAVKVKTPMVITSRPDEYARVATGRRHIPDSLVVSLEPVPTAEIQRALCNFLTVEDATAHELLDRVAAEPEGPLATALSSPFALWLMSKVYEDEDAAELMSFSKPDEILAYLLSKVVRTVYEEPGIDEKTGEHAPALFEPGDVDLAEGRLRALASYLKGNWDSQDIDWWRLQDKDPGTRLFVGGVTGAVVGILMAAALGYGLSARFGRTAGMPAGIGLGVTAALLAGVTIFAVGRDVPPTLVDFRFRWDPGRFGVCLSVGVAIGLTFGFAVHLGGGAVAGLLTAAVAGPVCGLAAGGTFGWRAGMATGINTLVVLGIASGLASKNSKPVVSGAVVGLVYVLSTWVFVGLFRPTDARFAVSPGLSFRRDRASALTIGPTAGMCCGVLYWIAGGPVDGVLALVTMTVTVTLTVSRWGGFSLARLWLALTAGFPPRIMSFLHDAYIRGLLRQVGASYQFRHNELRDALLTSSVAANDHPERKRHTLQTDRS